MIEFYKHKKGDIVKIFCCDSCARKSKIQPKQPADSDTESRLCDVCGHYNIGSFIAAKIGNWLQLIPMENYS
jgi:hypothetical protein